MIIDLFGKEDGKFKDYYYGEIDKNNKESKKLIQKYYARIGEMMHEDLNATVVVLAQLQENGAIKGIFKNSATSLIDFFVCCLEARDEINCEK